MSEREVVEHAYNLQNVFEIVNNQMNYFHLFGFSELLPFPTPSYRIIDDKTSITGFFRINERSCRPQHAIKINFVARTCVCVAVSAEYVRAVVA